MFLIRIRSLKDTCALRNQLQKTHVLSIRNVTPVRYGNVEAQIRTMYDKLDQSSENFASMLVLKFDDCFEKSHGGALATENDVKKALEWAKGKNDILVHCLAGISRSSAMAYIIGCQRMVPGVALKFLNFNIHSPNPLIVWLGSKIIGNPEIAKTCFDADLSDHSDMFQGRLNPAWRF